MNQAAILASLPSFLLSADGDPKIWWLLTVLLFAIVFLLVLILVVRLQAFVALILTSVTVAILSGMDLSSIPDTISSGMGGALGTLATIVGLGAIFGQVLEYSGGAQSLANSLRHRFGEKRAPFAMILVGFLISIPVFFDVALVIIAPILVAMAKESGKSILRYGLPFCAAGVVTHACIPPTPGPILVAENLGADLGTVILWGFVVGFPTALIAGLLGARMGDRLHVPIPKIFTDQAETTTETGGGKPVAAFEVIALIMLPIVLIMAQSLVKIQHKPAIDAGEAAGWVNFILFLGHPISALLLTTLITLFLLGTLRGTDKNTLMDLATKALGPAGIIILVTGAGGVFKTILVESGVGNALAETFAGFNAPLILLAFLLTMIIRVTQGSATVAMIGGSALMAAAVKSAYAAGEMSGHDVALVGIAIACGASMCSHVNDSGFWVVKNYLGMTEKQCLSTFTVITSVIGVVGFLFACLFSMIF